MSNSAMVSIGSLNRMILATPRQFLRVNFVRFLWSLTRWVWYSLVLRRLRTLGEAGGIAKNTVSHNLRSMLDLSVTRSLRLVLPLVSIEWVRTSIHDRTILTIGPRTEGEIWNLVSWGFRRKNITAVDLISYSPLVQLADMHDLPFPDHQFDIVMAGWVIAYSDQKSRAASEILRVVKPGGLIALGVEWSKLSVEEIAAQNGYVVGSAERVTDMPSLLSLFGDSVDHVYFNHDDNSRSGAELGDMLLIFRTPSCSPTASDAGVRQGNHDASPNGIYSPIE